MPPLYRGSSGPEAEHPDYAGQYRLETVLGSGGMGVVYLSRSTSGKRLAVKVVHAEFAADPEFRARFRQEVAAARRVSGAFTASVVDADPEAERPWMATLFVPGATLSQYVKRNGPLPPAELRHVMTGLAEALRDIHRAGVVHRDLKPSNVLLAADGPKVIDFGISRPSDSALRTETGKIIGTPPFMAPEQFRRPREVGPAADVFAMASVLVHAASGRGPFDSDSPYIVAYQVVHDEPVLKGIPDDLQPLIERCLAKDPDERPTPDALLAELRSVSASYDTQLFTFFDTESFIPPQRQPNAKRGPSGPLTHMPTPPPAPAYDGGGRDPRRARRVAAAGAAIVVLGAAGVLAAQLLPGGQEVGSRSTPHGQGSGPVNTATKTPTATWDASLAADGGTGTPVCSYDRKALYCVQLGIRAAKLDPATGEVLWSRRESADAAGSAKQLAPALSGGVLRVVSGDGSRLEGLDPATGGDRWDLGISAYHGAYYSAGATVLLIASGGAVTAVDGATGQERWHRSLPGHTRPVFTAYGDGVQGAGSLYAVEVAGDGATTLVTAVDPADGSARWQHRLDGDLTPAGASASGDALYFTETDAESRTDAVVRYDPADGRAVRVPLTLPLVSAQAAVHGDTVYLLGYGGALVAVGTEGRKQLWRTETAVAEASEPVVTGGRLYLTAADGRLLAFDAADGDPLGQTRARLGKDVSGYVQSVPPPIAAGGRVYATAPDGTVFAVDAKDPSRW